ncbi:25S rRNA (adenine(2142)-N(1))-methyltransferase Bmt2 [Trinorchestia longiramus]|nr:25S rRNA (adenine(2142)-N(1))-methyltransferase Bmt2 [Trinorchestia longiramus]
MDDLDGKSAKELADILKTAHRKLREECLTEDAASVWSVHLRDTESHHRYASAMHALATRHWDTSNSPKAGASSRITWTHAASTEYFEGGGLQRAREKENRKVQFLMPHLLAGVESSTQGVSSTTSEKLRVLDVGSCYNPFARYSEWDVTAVDLHPATQDVLQCDFLNLNLDAECSTAASEGTKEPADSNIETQAVVLDKSSTIENSSCVPFRIPTNLRANYFDIVIFCLLLEYIPSAEQRFKCCQNATKLLRPEGILIIITPDSKYEGHNNFLYKAWQAALAGLGLTRVKYEKKEHFHGMVFRKGLHKEVWQADSMRLLDEIKQKKMTAQASKDTKLTRRSRQMMTVDINSLCSALIIPQDLHFQKDDNSSPQELSKTAKRPVDHSEDFREVKKSKIPEQ